MNGSLHLRTLLRIAKMALNATAERIKRWYILSSVANGLLAARSAIMPPRTNVFPTNSTRHKRIEQTSATRTLSARHPGEGMQVVPDCQSN